MKHGMPEVLVIGESHPDLFYYEDLEQKGQTVKFGKIRKKISVSDLERAGTAPNLLRKISPATAIILGELRAIKNFGAKRILYELPATTRNRQGCRNLLRTRNLAKFQKELLHSIALHNEKFAQTMQFAGKKYGFQKINFDTTANLAEVKVLSFLIGSTGVYDIHFFDDQDAIDKEGIYETLYDFALARHRAAKVTGLLRKELRLARLKRDTLLVENAKKLVADKTVIICGGDHLEDMVRGLRHDVYLTTLKL